jgi:hypothetical protein
MNLAGGIGPGGKVIDDQVETKPGRDAVSSGIAQISGGELVVQQLCDISFRIDL